MDKLLPLRLRLKHKLRPLLHNRWFPDRKAIASGLGGVLAFYLAHLLHLSPDTAMAAVTAVTTIITYLVPASVTDLVRSADLIITDVTGKVTDLLWKFDREKGEMRRTINRKGTGHAETPIGKTKDDTTCDKSDSVAGLGDDSSCNGKCGCDRTQDKPSVPEQGTTETSGGST